MHCIFIAVILHGEFSTHLNNEICVFSSKSCPGQYVLSSFPMDLVTGGTQDVAYYFKGGAAHHFNLDHQWQIIQPEKY
ncbi:hypothetical protein AOXY_G16168 [Acipenser oxyrinchus oxyrinchus]|uniref:Uncharacterized protein n=1 Tax=Acipenser oxyrinchus oxyrinchus TaxID=40147 RepID=A0AAD8D8E9_ACIOX|nr:hypothetical protein AOXY_G16168 [Acipenser oxyrinchus oxyrinchus]